MPQKITFSPEILKLIRDFRSEDYTDHQKYKKIAKHIIYLIRKGKLTPGTQFPSIPELEKALSHFAGRVTVVNAYRELVRERYLISRHGLGTFVNKINSEENPRVALIIPMFSVYIQIYAKFAAMLQLLVESIKDRLWLLNSHETPQTFIDSCEEAVFHWGAKFLVAVPPINKKDPSKIDKTVENYLSNLNKKKLLEKIIIFDRNTESNFDALILQNRQMGRKLLIERAATKKIHRALFLMESDYKITDRKELTKFASKLGLTIDFKKRINTEKTLENADKFGAEALFFDSDIFATRFMTESRDKNKFKIAGYDATNYALLNTPQITSVDPGFCEAAEIAFSLINGKAPSTTLPFLLKPKLIVGDTL
ncbi:MAG TPA: GntR family transcriptional regulator [Victivallales bacterium]|nr:GntR family transcriptional regulator [Victivallales bacterium]